VTTPEQPLQPVPLLIVDDEAPLRDALGRYLREQGFAVTTVGSGDAAIEELRRSRYHLMLLDIRMPGMSGIDTIPEALDIDPDLAVIMLSAVTDATSAANCMQRGAMDYLTKPIELTDLMSAVHRALRRRDTLLQSRGITSWLREEVQRRGEEVVRERSKQEQITLATLEALINALEAKNVYLRGHSARIAALAATIAHELGLSDEAVEHVRMAGRLHDLGKIGIREEVLNREGPLTEEEYEHVKTHVVIGSQILGPLTHLGPIVGFVRGHHEHWDGSGYPDALSGEEIPLGARIICAAEVYDALTQARPYHDKLRPDEAIERMRLLAGTVLDPQVMDALAAAVARRRTLIFLDEDAQHG
jgi:response regulator RpfG family c-di-GMP phosphodiesterase